MPRKSRLNVPGAVYHVMSRCRGHLSLFHDDADREKFLSLLEKYLTVTGAACYAWALMDTHYNLVVRLGFSDLVSLMKPLNMHYAYHHRTKNKSKKQSGTHGKKTPVNPPVVQLVH